MTVDSHLIDQIRTALDSADLDSFADLLAPDVQWGSPGDPQPSCQNRRQVLNWWRAGRDAGVRADVASVEGIGDKVLVHLRVSGSPAADDVGDALDRWQVLAIRDGQVADIRGYEELSDAEAAVGRT